MGLVKGHAQDLWGLGGQEAEISLSNSLKAQSWKQGLTP